MAELKRNYGIDLLRIVACLMVISIHVGGFAFHFNRQGGYNWYEMKESTGYTVTLIAYILRIISYPAVNCFALISGYVGIKARWKISNIIYLTIQVLFYTVGGTLIFMCVMPEKIFITDLIKAFFPVGLAGAYQYWYFTAYFGLYFLMPLLNIAVKNTPRAYVTKILSGLFLVFFLLPTILLRDIFNFLSGFSVIHLVLLYLIGAYIRYFDISISNRASLLGFFVSVILTVFSVPLISGLSAYFLGAPKGFNLLISYTSPTIVVMSVSLLCFFSKIHIHKLFYRKIISVVSSCALGIYFVHLHPLVKKYVLVGFFDGFDYSSTLRFITTYVVSIFIIFICGFIIDFIKRKYSLF